ncbi:2Fe-2S iron-sulfur cluster-binding protein [Sphingopyxis panaciterrulae]|uniref:2Fe-2S ferredoxin n=1 Tax=Sphingopyxis panaciterrulae TaxID=462372 RepID=A0A7W9B760_9SPHN|nr:2Fe-2S iron-sulfur cluster-binding protein [Sphingopyxis panaciterrulae]MBB5707448.1 2Fe-2S ferredoxin [Sphingopyxis panaciterrulae]
MVKVVFKKEGAEDRVVEGQVGNSIMETALDGNIGEILADCGGALSCATCHVYVPKEWQDRVGTAGAEEEAMLEMAVDPDERSRLSCQIGLSDEMDGVEIILPKSQL